MLFTFAMLMLMLMLTQTQWPKRWHHTNVRNCLRQCFSVPLWFIDGDFYLLPIRYAVYCSDSAVFFIRNKIHICYAVFFEIHSFFGHNFITYCRSISHIECCHFRLSVHVHVYVQWPLWNMKHNRFRLLNIHTESISVQTMNKKLFAFYHIIGYNG